MVIVIKFGTFWMAYCPACAWQSGPVNDWRDAEKLRSGHACEPEAVRIKMQRSLHALLR